MEKVFLFKRQMEQNFYSVPPERERGFEMTLPLLSFYATCVGLWQLLADPASEGRKVGGTARVHKFSRPKPSDLTLLGTFLSGEEPFNEVKAASLYGKGGGAVSCTDGLYSQFLGVNC